MEFQTTVNPKIPIKRKFTNEAQGGVVQKKPNVEKVFEIIFSSIYSFKELLRNVANVILKLTLKVVCEEDFTGIKIDTLTNNKSCLCTVRYKCSVKFAKGSGSTSQTVFLNLKTLHEILKKIPNHVVVRMFQKTGSSCVYIQYVDQLGLHHYSVNTRLDGEAPTRLKELSSKYTMQVGVGLLRNFSKQSKALKAKTIALSILRDTENKAQYIELGFQGQDAGGRRLFLTSNGDTKSVTSADILARSECFERLYSKQFDNSYIALFIKTMEKDKKLTLAVGDSPLIITYELGVDSSYIRYVLAESAEC